MFVGWLNECSCGVVDFLNSSHHKLSQKLDKFMGLWGMRLGFLLDVL